MGWCSIILVVSAHPELSVHPCSQRRVSGSSLFSLGHSWAITSTNAVIVRFSVVFQFIYIYRWSSGMLVGAHLLGHLLWESPFIVTTHTFLLGWSGGTSQVHNCQEFFHSLGIPSFNFWGWIACKCDGSSILH